MSNLLDDLFFKYKADKTPRIKHHYSDVYFNLFKDRRESIKKVLEIGTAEGASLFAWRDFFPNAQIYGGEIDQKRVDLMEGEERIKVLQCDQSKGNSNRHLIAETGFDLDLIIDDGSHRESDQFFTCLTLMPWLSKNVVYVIEDVDDNSLDSINLLEGWGYEIEIKHVGSRHDDRLVIVRYING